MARVWNFSAGPSTLPEQVLQTAAAEMMDYRGSGQSVMEMSHRSKVFDKIIKDAEALMRELYNVPDNYKVLFLQGGASAQFSAIPLNFMNGSGKADYISQVSGLKKHLQRLKNTATLLPQLHLQTKHLHTFQRLSLKISVRMQTMCIFV